MRRTALIALVLASVPAAAAAQGGATRSADDYVCALTDECDAAEAPADPAPGTGAKPRVGATRGFSLSRPAAKPSAPAGRPVSSSAPRNTATAAARPQPKSQPIKTASANRPKPAASKAEARRVDLRLTFKLGSADLTPQAMEEAKVFAQALQMPALASKRFVIEGHTDSQGSRASNIDLSQRRARTVADYLSSLGVSRDRFEVRGYGFDRPLNGRSAASQDNRRVEAVLVS